jgi:aryl-phospho-beta-D-glucosidase BglC (GH1 family)
MEGICVEEGTMLKSARRAARLLGSAALITTMTLLLGPTPIHGLAAPGLAARVAAGQLVDAVGNPLRLTGADREGLEYVDPTGFCTNWQGQHGINLAAMQSWHINAVRVPLNEDCWLNINGVRQGGAFYQNTLRQFVNSANAAGMYVIVDLHINSPGTILSTEQQQMPDADHAPDFWTSVASTFSNNPAVIFDLYNEPHPETEPTIAHAHGDPVAWNCWLNGSLELGSKNGFPMAPARISPPSTGRWRECNRWSMRCEALEPPT